METENENKQNLSSTEATGERASGTDDKRPREPLLDYVCHPARRDTRITALVTTFIVICIVIVWLISFSPLLTGLAVLILFGSLAGFYFPTRYIFYDDHLLVKTKMQTLRKDWSLYRSFYPDKNGVLLSPFGRPTRLENFRGLYVKFAGNREQVMNIVRSKIDFEDES
jgi:hypothetical protein